MPSTVTFEHYEVMTRDDGSLCELGRGAMGITYKGFDTRLRVPVALKVINAAHLHSETARQRFVREARSAARLRHRNVASVFHLGEEGDNYFYAMEFIDGETVDARVKRSGPLSPALALKVAAQVARALNAAQTHELVHRDIKPANLMLVNEDDELIVKVIDFGLAKVALAGGGEDAATLTMSGFLGTPHFASPEQLEEREIDVRSDIYSLGVTLWFALTGKTPFTGSVMQVMSQHITRQPPFEQLENLPVPVVELLRGMLDKNPAQRPQTAIELRREIERCLSRIGDAEPDETDVPATNIGHASTVSESDETQFETGAAIGTRYIVSEQIGETESGRVFRARDGVENRDVRLLALDRELLADTEAVAQIEAEAARLCSLAHPNVLGVYGITNDGRSAYLTLEWIDGFSLRDLLRARRELALPEVLALLPQAAAGVDAAHTVETGRLNLTLHQLSVHFSDCEIAPENLLRRPVDSWPAFTIKFNALTITRDRFSLTWDGSQTIVGARRDSPADAAAAEARVVYDFAAVVYEMLGGSPAAIGPQRYTPLASLGESGNEILRRAILSPTAFGSATEFSQFLIAPPPAAPPAPLPPPVRSPAATTTPEAPPSTEIRITEKSPEPIAATVMETAAAPPPLPEAEPIPELPIETPPAPEPISSGTAIPAPIVEDLPPPVPEPEPAAAIELPPPALEEAPKVAPPDPAPPELPVENVAPTPVAEPAPEPIPEPPAPVELEPKPEPEPVVAEAPSVPPPTPAEPVAEPVAEPEMPAPLPEAAAVAAPPPPNESASIPGEEKPRKRGPAFPLATAALVLILGGSYGYWHSLNQKSGTLAKVSPTPSGAPIVPDPIPEPTPVPPTPVPPPPPPTRMELANLARKKAEDFEAKQENHQALIAWLDLATTYSEFKPGRNGLEDLLNRLQKRPGGLSAQEFTAMRSDIEKAAKLDVVAAMMLLGEQLQTTEPPTALEWFSAAAERNNPIAMTRAAYMLSNGVGAAADPEKVVSYLKKASAAEEPNAMIALGQLHLDGRFGVPVDHTRSIELLTAAVAKGNSRAMNSLGNCYYRGIGVKSDAKEAFRLFSRAAEDPDAVPAVRAEAIGNLGALYFNGDGVPKKDQRTGVAKLRSASELGHVPSMYAYATALNGGKGVSADPAEARKWYRKAAEGGHAKAAEWCKKNGEQFTPPASR